MEFQGYLALLFLGSLGDSTVNGNKTQELSGSIIFTQNHAEYVSLKNLSSPTEHLEVQINDHIRAFENILANMATKMGNASRMDETIRSLDNIKSIEYQSAKSALLPCVKPQEDKIGLSDDITVTMGNTNAETSRLNTKLKHFPDGWTSPELQVREVVHNTAAVNGNRGAYRQVPFYSSTLLTDHNLTAFGSFDEFRKKIRNKSRAAKNRNFSEGLHSPNNFRLLNDDNRITIDSIKYCFDIDNEIDLKFERETVETLSTFVEDVPLGYQTTIYSIPIEQQIYKHYIFDSIGCPGCLYKKSNIY